MIEAAIHRGKYDEAILEAWDGGFDTCLIACLVVNGAGEATIANRLALLLDFRRHEKEIVLIGGAA